MILFLLLIILVLIGLTAAAVLGKIGGSMAEATSTRSFDGIPDGPLSENLAELHFDQALRGYRMDQVDEVIDALGNRVRELESEVASRESGAASRHSGVASPESDVASVREPRQE